MTPWSCSRSIALRRPVVTATAARIGSRPVAKAFWLRSSMTYTSGTGMLAASESSRTTSIRIASRFGSAGRAPAVSRMIREPNRLPMAATPIPAIAAMTATVRAVVARKVRLAVDALRRRGHRSRRA